MLGGGDFSCYAVGMGIGWVMFGKAIVLAIAIFIGERWKAFRKRRSEQGLPMRKNRKGVYVVFDWAAVVERTAVRVWNMHLDFFIVATIALAIYGWWTGVLFN